uniref:Uncharacterized protein n=1 Tax=Romanomermis culicivorax TaxID=13658 RepID=A0A915KTM9_ROMCU
MAKKFVTLQAIANIISPIKIAVGAELPYLRKTHRIDPTNRIWGILIDVDATGEADRILADESPATRIIVPIP